MRLKDRNQLITILNTVQEMLEYIRTLKTFDQIVDHIIECKTTVEYLRGHITNTVSDFNDKEFIKLVSLFDTILEDKNQTLLKKTLKKADRMVDDAKHSILKGIKVKWTALFLPFKASMWTSLESIWIAANEDPDCEAVVMPIPYYELDTIGKKKRLCYEGEQFLDYVPVVDYTQYNIESTRPEMIFIHNPYDDANTMTRVLECFYSENLRSLTNCLVFSCYFTYGVGYIKPPFPWFTLPGLKNAHKIIAQSKKVETALIEDHGYDRSKLLTLGSPKMDAIFRSMKTPPPMPTEWETKLSNRSKVFLLNTHMLYFAVSAEAVRNGKFDEDYAIKYHKEILETLIDKDEYGLIWRPHPLLKTVLDENDPVNSVQYKDALEFVNGMETLICNSSNAIIDRSEDYRVAFQHSDAFITPYSSLIQEYMATGKPVLIYEPKQSQAFAEKSFVPYLDNYFRLAPDNITFDLFAKMVLDGDDPMKAQRLKTVNSCFLNLDGTAGERIYRQLCFELDQQM